MDRSPYLLQDVFHPPVSAVHGQGYYDFSKIFFTAS